MIAADFLIRSFQAAGVDTVFGLPGVHALGLWRAIEKAGMRYIGFRHEQAAAHAADGYGRATGKPGVVLLSTGPGALNALSALGEAYVSSSPVFAITSAIPSKYVGKKKGYLHEAEDLQPAFGSVTSYSARVESAQDLPIRMMEAMAKVTTGRRRPVMLEIPVDLIDAEISEASFDPPPFDPPPPERVDEAATLMGLAARPVLWAGGGVLRSNASDVLRQLAETLHCPVITTFMGKGALSEAHALSAGTCVRLPEGEELLREADLLIAVGTRFSGMSTANWKLQLPSQLIHIDIDQEEVGRNYPARVGIVSDAAAALEAILDKLSSKQMNPRDDKWGVNRVAELRRRVRQRGEQNGEREIAMLDAIRSAIPDEVPMVHDMTIPSYWSAPFLPLPVPGTWHFPYGYASLGFSLPAAVGVCAGMGNSTVVSFNGDGGFQYHLRELATIAQYALPVVTLVFNDRAWGILKAFSTSRYGTTFGLDLPGPDFPGIASAYGIPAARADTPEEVSAAIDKALATPPYLIEVPGEWRPPPPAEYYR